MRWKLGVAHQLYYGENRYKIILERTLEEIACQKIASVPA